MSIIQSIRDKAAWIISVAIGLALIAFIAQDSSVRAGASLAGNDDIAVVNGKSIAAKDYNQKVEMVSQMNGGQQSQEQVSAQVYNVLVQQEILRQQYEKLGLAVSRKELDDILFGANPPQWLQQAFTDQKTGVYDAAAARQQLSSLGRQGKNGQAEQVKQAYLLPTIDQAMATKYQSLIVQAAYIPGWLTEKQTADNNSIASGSFVYVPYASLPDSSFAVTDADIENYVARYPSQFQRENETRTANFVSFESIAGREDSAALRNSLTALRSEFASAADARSFVAAKGSTAPFDDAFVTASNMKMGMADTLKQLAPGAVYGPYLDGNTMVLARMIARRSIPDSVKVRHILIKTGDRGQPVLADSIAKKRIDSIRTAISGGAGFNEMVLKYSDDDGSKTKGGEYEFASQQFSSLSKEFAEVAFYGNSGDRKVVKTENNAYSGYHYIEVVQQKNIQPAYKIAYIMKPVEASAETINTANTAATQFAANARNKEAFEAEAKKAGKIALPTGEISPSDYQVSQLGSNRQFVRWMYENEVNTVSQPFEFNDRFVVAIISGVNKAGLASAAIARPQVEAILRNEKKAQRLIAEKFKGNTLEEIARNAGTKVQPADSISFQAGFIPAVGAEGKVAGLLFNKNMMNKVSEPVAGNSGVFAVKPATTSARPGMGGTPDQIRQGMLSNLKQQIGYRSLEALRMASKVEDKRP